MCVCVETRREAASKLQEAALVAMQAGGADLALALRFIRII